MMTKYIFLPLALSIFLLCSCSTEKYTGFSKIKRDSHLASEKSFNSNQDEITIQAEALRIEEPQNTSKEKSIMNASSEKNAGIILNSLKKKEVNSLSREEATSSPEKFKINQNIEQKIIKQKVLRKTMFNPGKNILWTIILVLLVLWLLALLFGIGSLGGFVHILLVVALVLLIYKLLT
jgi:hypothetical protein